MKPLQKFIPNEKTRPSGRKTFSLKPLRCGDFIYLDIDGVILTKGGKPALHLDKFLKYVLNKYTVFWLTTRCHGDVKYTVNYLAQFLLPETVALIGGIKPTSFQLDKTEAIDFSKDFFWFDDELFASEKNILKEYGKYESWIEVNLVENPDQLAQLVASNLHSNYLKKASFL